MTKIFLVSTILLFIIMDCYSQTVNKNDLNKLLEKVNTRFDEQNPILSPDGKMLYFTRANDSLNIGGTKDKGDIWVSQLESDGMWSAPENLGAPVNDDLKNYILGFSPDGNIMFLNNEKKNPGGLVINDGVAYSVFSAGSWSKPALLSVDYLLNKSAHQSGSISAGGSTMLLSLQAYASRGEEDIYVSTYQSGRWTQPINLGSTINTAGQEMTPYLSPDKKSLYFSSNGHGGRGGRDLFVSERLGDGWTEWSKPKNLGNEVNSIGVELNYFIDSRNSIAYFSSTQNSDGYGDIKAHNITIDAEVAPVEEVAFTELVQQADEERRTITLYGKIVSAASSTPVAAALNLVFDDFAINTNSDEETGNYQVEIPLKTREIEVTIKAPGFMGFRDSLSLSGTDYEKDFEIVPLEVGATITLNKVYFDRGTAVLQQESFPELETVIDMMNENPNVRIELAGHTDNQGNSKLNIQLSQERVDVVKRYLTEQGIDGKRIRGKGYGGTRPVASNASEETRKLNRRVEFTIVKN